MRVQVREGDAGEAVLIKFDPDEGLEGFLEACRAKIGFRPAAVSVKGAKILDTSDLEDGDEVRCEREAPSSRKRAAEGEPDRENQNSQAGKSAAAATDAITIKVVQGDGTEVMFKVKRSTKIQKILRAHEQQAGVQPGSFRYTLDGDFLPDTRRDSDDTIEKWDMQDGDSIDAHVEQTGGGRQ